MGIFNCALFLAVFIVFDCKKRKIHRIGKDFLKGQKFSELKIEKGPK